ncbi:hypothetical protein [Streptomyces sp. TRM68367]|uniref:hypothetical protein n=1 Tax=Streptomyces sp. TRM68367 TaxID=2758415 RepID=UPI0021D04C81|nr:hypothetical protein [Streptomyces sp. TRM68367]
MKPSGTNSPAGPGRTTSGPTSTPGSFGPWPHTSALRGFGCPRGNCGLLPPPPLAHAALLTELARLAPDTAGDQLVFAARLAAADLTVFLTRATETPGALGSPA